MKQITISLFLLLLLTGCSQKQTAVISDEDKEGLISNSGEVIVKPVYKRVYSLEDFNSNTYYHPHYVNLHWLHVGENKYAVVKNIDNKYGIINENGELKLKALFDSIGTFFNGFAKIEIDKKFGLINENFEIVLKPIYDDVRNMIDGKIIVNNYTKNGKIQYGCLDSNMKLILPLEYNMIYLSSENRMRVEKDGLWGFIDTDCKIISEPQYKYADDFSKGLARVQKDTLWTYIDLDGDEIERKTFHEADNF